MENATKKAQGQSTLSQKQMNQAVNAVGHSLFTALSQSLQQLPEDARNKQVTFQGIAGFLANITHQQSPNQKAAARQMLEHIYKLADNHLKTI